MKRILRIDDKGVKANQARVMVKEFLDLPARTVLTSQSLMDETVNLEHFGK